MREIKLINGWEIDASRSLALWIGEFCRCSDALVGALRIWMTFTSVPLSVTYAIPVSTALSSSREYAFGPDGLCVRRTCFSAIIGLQSTPLYNFSSHFFLLGMGRYHSQHLERGDCCSTASGLSSFRTHWWFNKPLAFSALAAARRGWTDHVCKAEPLWIAFLDFRYLHT